MKHLTFVILGLVALAAVAWFAITSAPQPKPLGAQPGPDATQECTSNGGLMTCRYSQSFAATSTACSFLAPRDMASSTLAYVSVRQFTATGTAQVIDIGNSTIAGGTTTILTRFVSAVNQSASFGSTTATLNGSLSAFRGGTDYLNVKLGGSAGADTAGYGGAQALRGVCNVEFREI